MVGQLVNSTLTSINIGNWFILQFDSEFNSSDYHKYSILTIGANREWELYNVAVDPNYVKLNLTIQAKLKYNFVSSLRRSISTLRTLMTTHQNLNRTQFVCPCPRILNWEHQSTRRMPEIVTLGRVALLPIAYQTSHQSRPPIKKTQRPYHQQQISSISTLKLDI